MSAYKIRPNVKKNEQTTEKVDIPPKRQRTAKQLNTSYTIHEQVTRYDILLRKYASEPTAENKQELDDYSVHLTNVTQLASHVFNYIDDNHLDNTILALSKIRKIITEEIEAGRLIKIDGLIRNPKTNPYENVSSTGNVIPIILPYEYIDDLKSYLAQRLVNESVRILVPCNNMILIVETGEYTDNVNRALKHDIFKAILTYASDNKLPLPTVCEPEGIVKYILK